MMQSAAAFNGDLQTRLIRPTKPHRARSVRVPKFGRILFTRDQGDSTTFAREYFSTNLTAVHRDGDGVVKDIYDLGSGLVTNVGVTALANDFAWAQNAQTLKLSNWHASGTGATAAAATDIALQTLAAPTTTTAVAGVQSLVSAANSQIYRTVATINYTSTLAVTEWGLHTAQTLTAATGSPLTASSATGGTATGTPYSASSASVQGQQQLVIRPATTTVYGLILSNTTSAVVIPAWYKVADGTAGATPGATEAFTIIPVLWDHKVFAAINVVNGDAVQYSYSLTCNSGG
jgi:hypothetical protein